ncbi:MAG: outer membrane protein [Phenylobacterium sp.]
MTNRLLLATAVGAVSLTAMSAGSPALAQKMPWSGFYIGGNIGGAWGDTNTGTVATQAAGSALIPPVDLAALNAAPVSSSNKSGFTGGFEGGYNWVSDGFLLGIETDWGFLDVNQSSTQSANSALTISPPLVYTVNQHLTTDWIWTLRPRIGFVTDRWLFYATGGIAATSVKYSMRYSDTAATPRTATLEVNDTKSGWTAGLGGGYALSPEWSLKGEWLYADFGHIRGSTSTAVGSLSFTSDSGVKANIFRVGVDYTF